jgi:molybdate transport system substrate-binding protein
MFAATSLKTTLDEIAIAFEADTGMGVQASYATSPALAKQIEAGAPADVFASADRDWMAYLSERNLVLRESVRELLSNTLVLVSSQEDPIGPIPIAHGFPLRALLGDGRLAITQVDSAPAGRYAKVSLVTLGVWPHVADRLAQAENVRAALMLVAREETPLGIVYLSDAIVEPKVRVVGTLPRESHPEIIYPFAITSASRHSGANAYLDFLSSPVARRIFESSGFLLRD